MNKTKREQLRDDQLRIKINKLVESKFDTDSVTEMYHKIFIDMAEHGYRLANEENKKKAADANPTTVDPEIFTEREKVLMSVIEKQNNTLKFYSDKNNWMRSWITNGENIKCAEWADKLKIQDCAMLNCGGGRARLTLAEVSKMMEGLK